ncbi:MULTISPECIES: Flp family type IVb pilin [Pseudoalteromonas]|uniref:Flp family type IVb pilin n=1 Tax=Pseudoalteromonas TaxID=53246 RepID=UPI00026C9983|nr:hypothetical protein PSPO_a1588 [Pseudoalteromonas spongiae UST010723-006]
MKKRQLGQGMTEYIIIVALIAVAAIGVYSFFGKTVRNQVSALATEVGGTDSSTQIQAAKTAAEDGAKVADKNYNLGNYNEAANKSSN